MAIFKKFNGIKNNTSGYASGEDNTGVVVNPSDGTLWMNGIPYDSNTLYPLFDKKCTAFSQNVGLNLVQHGFVRTQMIAKAPCLQNGQNTAIQTSINSHFASTQFEERDSNLEDNKSLTSSSRLFHFQSSGGKDFFFYSSRKEGTYYELSQDYFFVEGSDFSNPDSVVYGTMEAASNASYSGYYAPIYVDTANKNIYFIHNYSTSSNSSYHYRSRAKCIARASYTTVEDNGSLSIQQPEAILLANSVGAYGTYEQMEANNFYYCGKNNNNTLMFLEFTATDVPSFAYPDAATRSSSILNAESYDVSNGTVSTIATLTTSNLTDSSKAAKIMMRARPTSCVNSPISGETNIYYTYYPVSDVNSNISFVLASWDKSANTNAGSVSVDNCTMTYNSGVVTDYLEYPLIGTSNSDYNLQIKSNSFITVNAGAYYLHYLPSYGSPENAARQSATAKNLVTYAIDSTDFSQLTYHSSVQINSLDFVHLNSSRTKIAVIKPGELAIYTWNNGWSVTASESGNFTGVTQDASGRIIGLSSLSDSTIAPVISNNVSLVEHKVHLISDSLPNTVTIDFADTSLTYSGSNISTSVNINAYDSNNARISKSVQVKIDGANAQFTSNSSTTITVTTSASTDTNIPVTVSGPGPVSISAAFSL